MVATELTIPPGTCRRFRGRCLSAADSDNQQPRMRRYAERRFLQETVPFVGRGLRNQPLSLSPFQHFSSRRRTDEHCFAVADQLIPVSFEHLHQRPVSRQGRGDGMVHQQPCFLLFKESAHRPRHPTRQRRSFHSVHRSRNHVPWTAKRRHEFCHTGCEQT